MSRERVTTLPSGKLGMWIFLVTDAMSFAGLLTAYGALRARAASWPEATSWLNLPLAAALTFVLLGSSVTMALAADRAIMGRGARRWVLVTVLLGALFLSGQIVEYVGLARRGIGFSDGQAASTYYACTGWHALHLLAGLIYLSVVAVRRRGIETAALFWQFLDAVWIAIFTLVYLV